MTRRILLAAVLLIVAAAEVAAEGVRVRYRQPKGGDDPRNEYFVQILRLALQKTQDADGPFFLEELSVAVHGERSLQGVAAGILDVDWRMTSKEREKELLPVRIPLLKGLSGYRVLLIRDREQKRFDDVHSVQDLKAFKAGQAEDWLDGSILEANGLPLVKVRDYASLFFLLPQGRFDYLPRNVSEAAEEMERQKGRGIALENGLLLYYPAATYFFVARENVSLAERLRRGLEAALRDGSFDETFRSYPPHRLMLEQLGERRRRVLILENPLLPEGTPLDRKELWALPAPGNL